MMPRNNNNANVINIGNTFYNVLSVFSYLINESSQLLERPYSYFFSTRVPQISMFLLEGTVDLMDEISTFIEHPYSSTVAIIHLIQNHPVREHERNHHHDQEIELDDFDRRHADHPDDPANSLTQIIRRRLP